MKSGFSVDNISWNLLRQLLGRGYYTVNAFFFGGGRQEAIMYRHLVHYLG